MMERLTINVLVAVSCIEVGAMYKRWSLKDLDAVPKNNLKVFSFFSCGGGSSMGYKLAGYDVIGNCEIDKQIAEMYKANHHPLYSYNMDIRDFLKLEKSQLQDELYNLDVLDGSPPCSVFSIAGQREKDWGKNKYFREGQAAQSLDDLFMEYVKAVAKLQPKVFIAENVKGLIFGNAKGYVAEVIKKLDSIGYAVQIFCLNAAKMGVPQRRERVFLIGHKKELNYPKLQLTFDEEPIKFGTIRTDKGKPVSENTFHLLKHKIATDMSLAHINERLYGKKTGFNSPIVWDNTVSPTITAGGGFLRAYDDMKFSDEDIINCQTFPYDYDFCDMSVQYVCGMSVPPLMMHAIASQVARQWLLK